MKKSLITLMFASVLVPVSAQSEERMRGPLPDRQREIIHRMAEDHKKIHREVELSDRGYTARTTSKDEGLVSMLKEHFAYMQRRMGSGAMVRRWDPAFVEMVEHHDDITVTEVEVDNGVEVRVVGKTKDAVKIAKNHAKIISGFVRTGDVGKEHRRALR